MKNSPLGNILFVLVLLVPGVCFAQLSIDGIGFDPPRNESLACVRFTNPSQNTIEVTNNSSGQVKTISRKKARRTLKKSIKATNNKKKVIQKRIKGVNRKLKKLLSSVSLSNPKTARLEKLQETLSKLEQKRASFVLDVANLKESLRGVNNCGKEAQFSGQFVRSSGIYTDSRGNPQFYYGIYFVLDNWDPNDSSFCVKDSRFDFNTTILARPPQCLRRDLYPDDDTCYLHSDDLFRPGAYFAIVGGTNGPQEPGTCDDDPVRTCSLSDGAAKAEAVIAGVTFQFLGIPSSSQDCRDHF